MKAQGGWSDQKRELPRIGEGVELPPTRWQVHAAECAPQGGSVTVATINVQTLDPRQFRKLKWVGLRVTPRMAFIDAFLNKHGVAIAGIQ